MDESRSVPGEARAAIDDYLREAAQNKPQREDALGVITTAQTAYVQALPSARVVEMIRQFVGETDATNLAEGARLAIAVAPEDSANRVVLVSDGNETAGSLLAAAEAARARGVPVDVLPVDYDHRVEIVAERLIVPANARAGFSANRRQTNASTDGRCDSSARPNASARALIVPPTNGRNTSADNKATPAIRLKYSILGVPSSPRVRRTRKVRAFGSLTGTRAASSASKRRPGIASTLTSIPAARGSCGHSRCGA